MTIPIITDLDVARAGVLRRAPLDEDTTTAAAVAAIIAEVRAGGDAALRDLSERFDGVAPAALEVPHEAWVAALEELPADLCNALMVATEELRRFHERQARNSWVDFSVEGARGQLVVPLQRVGLYVPGGAAPLPSSLIHAAVPAQVAGVEELIVCSPPQRSTGLPAPVVLAAAQIVGVDRVFSVGGAQAIAAMAYGTASIPRVDKIAGPGNRFVIQAKRLVYGTCGIESLPGPTETLVIADAHAEPRFAAADLLAQAEHVDASAILLTPSAALAQAVQAEVGRQLEALPASNAQAASEAVSTRGGIVIVPDLAVAFDLANEYAPEHLCLLLNDPWPYVGKVRNAGGIFLGEQSFEVLGDYCAGPSHIMPTEGTARYASPVNVDDFRKVISLVGLNAQALARIGPAARRIAEAEGLLAHAAAVAVRLS
ncbi:histidinol dehydrogenase [Candidatus Viridilinea mediisalina]|uniref:Histidinol dehydrogenase n=1 Tax=Candidatus Viridilinea mediisalina TaxID=2024553 RepID=A0A2A6RHZ0_9CHLR|nr:histidinol dehydrogenase [Candidatus Viridilinea mediisalina]PDW02632.1 histidinol dehydrogenase [Candidatus Viridilinea mediisalina]